VTATDRARQAAVARWQHHDGPTLRILTQLALGPRSTRALAREIGGGTYQTLRRLWASGRVGRTAAGMWRLAEHASKVAA
jgi:hypothetical protein